MKRHIICIKKISDISLNYLLAAKLNVKKMVDLIVVKHNLNITFLITSKTYLASVCNYNIGVRDVSCDWSKNIVISN